MDDAERIPIDLGYEVASAAEAPSDQRITVREDGTLVIDILAPEPCAPEPTTEEHIVVCAEARGGESQALAPPPSPTAMEKLQEALTVKVGPVEIGPGGPDGAAGFGARIRF